MTGSCVTDDKAVVGMYWARNPDAIGVTSERYGNRLGAVARNILQNESDAEECVNDAYLRAWESIPPKCPENLFTYIVKIVRNLAFDKYKHEHADKRGGGNIALVLDELAECTAGRENVEQEIDRKELIAAINRYLKSLPEEKCDMFVCRYWYAMPVPELARRFGKSGGNISVILNRIRAGLREYLAERGFDL